MAGPLILPKRFGDRIDQRIAEVSRLAPSLVPQAEVDVRQKGVNVYRCPVCAKSFRWPDRFEPACTGPNETTDDHPMTVMEFVRVEPRRRAWVGGRP